LSKTSLVEHELQGLQKELKVLELVALRRRSGALDEIEVRGAALSLAALYSGMEKVLTHVLSDRGRSPSAGGNWHAELLSSSVELGVISPKTGEELKRFLGFRHFVRHAYSFEIDPQAIDSVLEAAPSLALRFISEIQDAIRSA
jgi:uncharacterized protein YutE (UPF0331/DUF86 family)